MRTQRRALCHKGLGVSAGSKALDARVRRIVPRRLSAQACNPSWRECRCSGVSRGWAPAIVSSAPIIGHLPSKSRRYSILGPEPNDLT
jgi:hypothetical protein